MPRRPTDLSRKARDLQNKEETLMLRQPIAPVALMLRSLPLVAGMLARIPCAQVQAGGRFPSRARARFHTRLRTRCFCPARHRSRSLLLVAGLLGLGAATGPAHAQLSGTLVSWGLNSHGQVSGTPSGTFLAV